jgi:isopenicillin N synthase-like dioxygenase/GrpB-like predicted nucleotidyltransferase (UPF0157 family)
MSADDEAEPGRHRGIVVVEYEPGWPALFEEIRAGLERLLEGLVLEIDHVGSTAVPGLCAKPKIDVDIVLRSTVAVPEAIERMKATGDYRFHGNKYRDGMWAFTTPCGPRGQRLYLCAPGTPTHLRRLLFRDHLRGHPEAAAAYAALKRRLASETADDWDHYTGGKASFVAETVQRQAVRSMSSIDVGPLFGPRSAARDGVDRQILTVAAVTGIMTITGLPDDIRIGPAARRRLLRLFDAPRTVIDLLSRNWHDPSRPLVYRGWFEPRPDRPSYFEGMEIGPDVAHGNTVVDPADPLKGSTPMPSDSDLPGWRAAVRDHYLGMERVADALMRSIARSLGQSEDGFPRIFHGGSSALRLLRYPIRPADSWANVDVEGLVVSHNGGQRLIASEAHTDFGCLTLLLQDEADGLQARLSDGAWLDIPPTEGHLVVNFGKLLERWTSRRILATEHRVLSPGRERFSLPFFYQPHLDARIEPLPLGEAEPFASFLFGDHVWASLPRLRRLFGERRSSAIPAN